MKIEAYQPLGHGDSTLLSHPVITKLAEKYGKDAGQIILRFEVQSGLIVLPKSTNPTRIAGNLRIFDFELTGEEMSQIRALDTGKGHHDPEAPGVAEMLLANFRVHDWSRGSFQDEPACAALRTARWNKIGKALDNRIVRAQTPDSAFASPLGVPFLLPNGLLCYSVSVPLAGKPLRYFRRQALGGFPVVCLNMREK